MESKELTQEEIAVIAAITNQIKETCAKNTYVHVCERIKTENGLAYVVNRSIKMMSNDKIKLGSALAILEAEMEGMD